MFLSSLLLVFNHLIWYLSWVVNVDFSIDGVARRVYVVLSGMNYCWFCIIVVNVDMDIVYCRLLIQLDMDSKARWRSRASIPRFIPGDFREGCPRMDEGNAHVQLQHVQSLFSEGFSCYQYLTPLPLLPCFLFKLLQLI